MKEFRKKLELLIFVFLARMVIHVIGMTSRFKVVGYDNFQKLVDKGQGFVIATWHGRTLLPIYYCRKKGIWAITSLSRDGELQTRIVSSFGYQIIRGSTGRGGIKAAITASKKLEEGGILSITPDGPLGPPNEVQEGIVFLADRANCPIVPIGVGARPGLKINSWDSYLFPYPFCKCALVFGKPIIISNLSTDPQGNNPAVIIKEALDDVQKKAQEMVREGC